MNCSSIEVNVEFIRCVEVYSEDNVPKVSSESEYLTGEGQAQIVEKEKKHYQGLPEDLTPTAGKVGASAAENRKIDKTERSRK